MASRAVTIAQDVADVIALNSDLTQTLTISVEQAPDGWATDHTVVRAYLAEYSLKDMAYMRCAVIPATFESVPLSRAARQETFGIDIVLQSRPTDLDDKDDMMELAEAINERLEYKTLGDSGAVWIAVERTPLFEAQRFDQGQMFATSSRHSFRSLHTVS